MKVLPLGALVVCLFAGPARADLEYAFNVTSASGAVQAFSFSFPSADFLADSDVPNFSPFTVIEGLESWTFTLGTVVNQPLQQQGCFEFGTTPDASLLSCSAGPGSPPSAAMVLSVVGGLPTATGVYNLGFSFFNPDPGSFDVLEGTLDITSLSSVPEPASFGLLAIVLAVVAWKLNRPVRSRTFVTAKYSTLKKR